MRRKSSCTQRTLSAMRQGRNNSTRADGQRHGERARGKEDEYIAALRWPPRASGRLQRQRHSTSRLRGPQGGSPTGFGGEWCKRQRVCSSDASPGADVPAGEPSHPGADVFRGSLDEILRSAEAAGRGSSVRSRGLMTLWIDAASCWPRRLVNRCSSSQLQSAETKRMKRIQHNRGDRCTAWVPSASTWRCMCSSAAWVTARLCTHSKRARSGFAASIETDSRRTWNCTPRVAAATTKTNPPNRKCRGFIGIYRTDVASSVFTALTGRGLHRSRI